VSDGAIGEGELVAFVPTLDLAAAEAFYGGVLGLDLTESSSFAVAFDVNGTQLRITRVEELAAAPFTVLGWRVDDLAASISSLEAQGVGFEHYAGLEQDEAGIWRAPGGSLIAWFKDPDGNTLSLQQPPRRLS
jgi:catechol 2,3-dioxygenase-like lactoylglutathione lyase family enzyme